MEGLDRLLHYNYPGPGYGTMPQYDLDQYFIHVLEAFAVYVDRDSVRQGLWKEFPAKDQLHQVKIKVDRVLRLLELIGEDKLEKEAGEAQMMEELNDMLNYTIFTKRIIGGEI